jgi:Cof subfamily protein (haloacid dehalogenase superfamily)
VIPYDDIILPMKHNDCSTIDIKAIAFDFDGTLLNPQKELSPKTIEAVEALKARGIRIILATGRSFQAMLPLKDQLGVLTPSINFNGAAVYDSRTGIPMHETLLRENAARKIIELGRSHGLHTQGFRHEKLLFEALTPEALKYQEHVKIEGHVVNFDDYESLEFTKLMYISEDTETISKLGGILDTEFPHKVHHCYSLPNYYEMMDGKVNKGSALSMLLDDLSIDSAQTMAFGDGHNDLPMLQMVGIGISMENANDEVKSLTQYHAPPNDRDGVARFLDGFFKLQIF